MTDEEVEARNVDPLELLRQVEQASYGEISLVAEEDVVQTWRGFAFSVEELDLVVPFASGFEVVPAAGIQPLPMSREWVRGMANIRGEIYTVVDFAQFLGRAPAAAARRANLFLLPDRKLKSALLLDSRIRLKMFDQDLPGFDAEGFDAALAPYLSAVLVEGDQRWGVVDVEALKSAAEFINIGR